MCRVAVGLVDLFAVNGICCDVCIDSVALLCGLGNVICNPQIVVAGSQSLVAGDGKCAVGCKCDGLAELLAVLLAPSHLLVGVNE